VAFHAVAADRLADLDFGEAAITQGPARPMSSEVMAAITARKVRYWNTRKKPELIGRQLHAATAPG
jgi:hypothetical protein